MVSPHREMLQGVSHPGTDSSQSNGGIWWSKDKGSVNSIANELFLSVAASLANRVPDTRYFYAQWALKEWDWFSNSGLISAYGYVTDGLIFTNDAKTTCQAVTSGNSEEHLVWTYNQGVVLGGLVELAQLTGDNSFLTHARGIANSGIYVLTPGGIVTDTVCEPNCDGGGTQFKGPFMRGLSKLNAALGTGEYDDLIRRNADSIWANDRDTSSNLIGQHWAGPYQVADNDATQIAALQALVAAVALG